MNKTTAVAVQTCALRAVAALADATEAGEGTDRDAVVAALHTAAHTCSNASRQPRIGQPGASLLLMITAELRSTAIGVGWAEDGAEAAAKNRLTFVAGVSRAMLAVLGKS